MGRTKDILWKPSKNFISDSNLHRYQQWLKEEKNLSFKNYEQLWKWSNEEYEAFWETLWEYFNIIAYSPYSTVVSGDDMPGTTWFEGSTLNYAEHIFRQQTTKHPALIYRSENRSTGRVSWKELSTKVAKVRTYLKQLGVGKGDRVSAYLANTPDAIICFLAANSLGAVWSCCSPDFGVNTVIDRFSQIEPKVFLAHDGYQYGGKRISRLKEIRQIVDGLSSIQEVILIPNLQHGHGGGWTRWEDVLALKPEPLEFEAVEFSHPIWVLYSSGTTGKPKAITHSHGGVLLEHLKYMHFHNDVKPGERFFWFTTTGWMMWNFLQASLLAGATAVLYDGSPGYPNLNTLWKFTFELPIHHFGTSAPYLVACMNEELTPGTDFDLSYLRSIGSTGAPLPADAFDWVYNDVSDSVWLCSMSGGTDVCTAFVGGIPNKPVKRGRIQGRALGCNLTALDEDGNEVTGSLGEMVISQPMPSMPVYFWGDEDHRRYRNSYFEKYPGKWCHGDWIKLYKDGSLIIQGRSDATLNRKGIRIGTAEIYSVLNNIPGISDSLIVNLEREDADDLMPLFIVTDEEADIKMLMERIPKELREQCSPRHVPDKIFLVDDVPYTLSGKKMEVPVKKALLGLDISKAMNKDACRNPEAMEPFISMASKLT